MIRASRASMPSHVLRSGARSEHPTPFRPKRARTVASAACAAALFVTCCQETKPHPAPATHADASASGGNPTSGAEPSAKRREEEDAIRPVYPVDGSPPDPLAQRLCDAVHRMPAQRRAECCASPLGGTPLGECVRTLSYALRSQAITLDSADVDKCAEAMTKELEGCGWVSPFPPALPAACDGIVHGKLKERDLCRSSLECADGLDCRGLSATYVGACNPPKPPRATCGVGIDALATFTRQDSVAASHPECAGYCLQRVCQEAIVLGGACKGSRECGPARSCLNGKCSDAPLPPLGQPCAGGACARGARCVEGLCLAPKAEGEACESDRECRGGCDQPDAGGLGKCAARCAVGRRPGPLGYPAPPSGRAGRAAGAATSKPIHP